MVNVKKAPKAIETPKKVIKAVADKPPKGIIKKAQLDLKPLKSGDPTKVTNTKDVPLGWRKPKDFPKSEKSKNKKQ